MTYLEKVSRFVESHPGFFAGQNDNGTTIIQTDVIDCNTGERWVEICSVWSIKGAREVLGY